jgi:hypothetical protein
MSVYRILYIKCDHWVKYRIGEKILLYSILLGGLALAIVCVVLFALSDYEATTIDWCILVPQDQMLQLLDDYEQIRRNPSIYFYRRSVGVVLGFVGIWMTVLKFVSTSVFFIICTSTPIMNDCDVFKIKKLLNVGTRKTRVHFSANFFLIEITLIVFLILQASMNGNNTYGLAFVWIKLIGFASVSIVEVLTSSQLRSRLFKRWSFVVPLSSSKERNVAKKTP